MTYCYNDLFSWGREVQAAIEKNKGAAQVFTHAMQVPDDRCVCTFLHISAKERDYTKELSEELAAKTKVAHIPTTAERRLHDELAMQHQTFGPWMPTMYLLRSLEAVTEILNRLPYPIVSRSSARFGLNTRVHELPDEAFQEAMRAFSDDGIALNGGGRQKDYVLWQPNIDRGQGHWHVFMTAQRFAVITDVLNPDYQIATVEILNERHVELLKYVYAFVKEFGFNWASVEVIAGTDVVRKVSSPMVVSVSVSWPWAWFQQGGMIFQTDDGENWKSTGLPSVRIWDVVARAILEGRYDG